MPSIDSVSLKCDQIRRNLISVWSFVVGLISYLAKVINLLWQKYAIVPIFIIVNDQIIEKLTGNLFMELAPGANFIKLYGSVNYGFVVMAKC